MLKMIEQLTIKEALLSRSVVAERSKALLIFRLRSWMRKVVGSNLGEAYTGFVFFCRDYIV